MDDTNRQGGVGGSDTGKFDQGRPGYGGNQGRPNVGGDQDKESNSSQKKTGGGCGC